MPEFYLVEVKPVNGTYIVRVYETKDEYDRGVDYDCFETKKVIVGLDDIGDEE